MPQLIVVFITSALVNVAANDAQYWVMRHSVELAVIEGLIYKVKVSDAPWIFNFLCNLTGVCGYSRSNIFYMYLSEKPF